MTELSDVLREISQLRSEIKGKGVMSWALPAGISAIVGVATIVTANLLLGPKDYLEHVRAISNTKKDILQNCNSDRRIDGAILYNSVLLPMYTTLDDVFLFWKGPAASSDEANLFYSQITYCLTETVDGGRNAPNLAPSDALAPEPPAKSFAPIIPNTDTPASTLDLNTDSIRDNFFGPQRLGFSNQLVQLAAQDPDKIAKALVGALVAPEDRERSYRVNLYIAFTLARFPNGWPKSADPSDTIPNLTTSGNYKDPTFAKRVREALLNRKPPYLPKS
jgi:hypothetical protein